MQIRIEHRQYANKIQLNEIKFLQTDVNDDALFDQERFVLLTSSVSYGTYICKILRKSLPRQKWTAFAKHKNEVEYSRIFRDEFAEEKFENLKICTLLISLAQRYHKYQWFLSGTPFEITSMNMMNYLQVLKNDQWRENKTLMIDIKTEMKKIYKAVQSIYSFKQPKFSPKKMSDNLKQLLNANFEYHFQH